MIQRKFKNHQEIPKILGSELSEVFDRAGVTVPNADSATALLPLLTAELKKDWDPTRPAAVEKYLRAGLLQFLTNALTRLYDTLSNPNVYRFSSESVSRS